VCCHQELCHHDRLAANGGLHVEQLGKVAAAGFEASKIPQELHYGSHLMGAVMETQVLGTAQNWAAVLFFLRSITALSRAKY
jgi:hypothetical protein